MALSHADRVRLGLEEPITGEFEPAGSYPPQAPGGPQNTRAPALTLVVKPGERASAPKIRQMVNELLAANVEQAHQALNDLFKVNPKLGLELYIELAQFSLPKLKAVAVQVDDRSENPKALSFAQLQQALQGE